MTTPHQYCPHPTHTAHPDTPKAGCPIHDSFTVMSGFLDRKVDRPLHTATPKAGPSTASRSEHRLL